MKIYKALLMAIILVVGFFYIQHYGPKEVKEGPQSKEIKLFAPNQAQFIALKRKDSFLSAIKEPNTEAIWKLVDPEGAPADNAELKKLLQSLSDVKTQAMISPNEQSQDKASYGLNPPELVVTVNDGEKDHRFIFGALNFISGRRYFQVEGDNNIYLIDSLVFRSVDLVEGQFRESRPYQFKVQDIEEVIATPFNKNSVQLVRQKDNSWRAFGEGSNVDADGDMIIGALQQIASFQAEKFIDLDTPKSSLFGLDPASLRIEIRFKDQQTKPVTLLFGEAKKLKALGQKASNSDTLMDWEDTETEFYTKNDAAPWIYKMKSPIHREFYRSALEFKKKEIFADIALEKLYSLLVKSAANGEVIVKKDEQNKTWNLTVDPTGKKETVAVEKLSAYVDSLSTTRVLSFYAQPVPAEAFGPTVLEIQLGLGVNSIKNFSIVVGQKINSKSEENATDAPRYVKVREPNGAELYGVVGSELLVELDKPKDFFLR